ncbi:MAG: sugar ABC transporter ATP-binding protein [Solirubrobacterales bacterium]|nr:sugar ABC transporter ATP-binding protein [Solirubrobacterales bacterium]
MAELALELKGVGKSYGATRALDGIDLAIEAGTVHALVGENGAGKSTTLGIAGGRVVPTDGEVEFFGRPLEVGQPRRIQAAGMVAIYQELTIVEAMTAEANVFLGNPVARPGGLLARGEMKRGYTDLARRFGVKAWPGMRAGSLSVAEQQLLEIMRALAHDDVRMILFDEPTASLALSEKEALHELIRDLRERGYTMALVSHDLDEVLDLSDAITVFREGNVVSSRPRSEWDKESLVEAMLGRSASSHRERIGAVAGVAEAKPYVEVRDLKVDGVLDGVDIDVRPGEIVGIAGLVGSGRSTILRSLAGAEPASSGRLAIDGEDLRWPRTVRAGRRHGVGLLPEDRKGQGIIAARTAAENAVLTDLASASSFGWVSRKKLRAQAAEAAVACGFDRERLGEEVRHLSGGNQQKLLLSRWKHSRPRLLLCDEPTRGIDIGAKEEMMATIEEMAADGLGVIVVSSELEELLAMCHRILVLSGGRIVDDVPRGEATLNGLLQKAFSEVGSAA